jgi:hypothetical protein
MKQLVFGVHLPVMGFNSRRRGSTEKNREKEKPQPHAGEQILSIARKAESLGYDSLSVNDHIVFRTSWLDSLSILSGVAAVTNRIKLGTFILNIVVRSPVICAKSLAANNNNDNNNGGESASDFIRKHPEVLSCDNHRCDPQPQQQQQLDDNNNDNNNPTSAKFHSAGSKHNIQGQSNILDSVPVIQPLSSSNSTNATSFMDDGTGITNTKSTCAAFIPCS